jgi:hypothetical protein
MVSAISDMNPADPQEALRRSPVCDSPNYRAISCELYHSSHVTAAIMASPLAAVGTVRARPAFISAVNVTLYMSNRDAVSIFRNPLASV